MMGVVIPFLYVKYESWEKNGLTTNLKLNTCFCKSWRVLYVFVTLFPSSFELKRMAKALEYNLQKIMFLKSLIINDTLPFSGIHTNETMKMKKDR